MLDRIIDTPRQDSKHHSVYDQYTGAKCVVRMGTVLVPVHKADRMDSIMYIKTDNHQQRHSPTNNLFFFRAYDFVWRLEGCGHDGNVKKERRKENKKKNHFCL